VTVGINPSFLGVGSYSGTVTVQTVSFGSVNFTVNLNVGAGGSGVGLAARPNPVTFNGASGFGGSSQNVTNTLNGVATTVNSIVSSTTNTGQALLQPSVTGVFGMVLVSVNPSALSTGSDTGTVTVGTPSGNVSFTVTLTIGGGSTS